MATTVTKLNIRVNPVIEKGFGTWLGVGGAIVGYAGSILTFLTATDQEAALAPFGAATLVLYKVLAGRFQQASDAIKASAAERVNNPKVLIAPQGASVADLDALKAEIERQRETSLVFTPVMPPPQTQTSPRPIVEGSFRSDPEIPS